MSRTPRNPEQLKPPEDSEAYVARLAQDWRVLELNDAARRLLGRGDEALGRDFWDLFPLSSGSYARDILEKAVRGNVPTRFHAYCDDLDAWFNVCATPTATGLTLVAHDVKNGRKGPPPAASLSEAGLEKIAEEMRRMADQLVRQSFDEAAAEPPRHAGEPWTDRRLAKIADAIYRDRRRRVEHFPVDFAEPQWNILLDLFIQEVRGVRVSVTSACIAADVPQTTALRAVQQLIAAGLVSREADPEDRRRAWIALTPQGLASMRGYLRHSEIVALAA